MRTEMILPQDKGFEELVLGAIMIEENAIDDVIEFLSPETFYDSRHTAIYTAMIHLYHLGAPIDLSTVSEQLKKTGELDSMGGAYYIAQLTNKIGSAANIEYHGRLIAQKYYLRKLITAAQTIERRCFENYADPFEEMDIAQVMLDEIVDTSGVSTGRSYIDIVADAKKNIEEKKAAQGVSEHPTGISKLDKVIDPMAGDVVLVAARPGMGKTAFGLKWLRTEAEKYHQIGKGSVGFVTLEMRPEILVKRQISAEAKVDIKKYTRGEGAAEDEESINQAVRELSKLPILIADTMTMTARRLRSIVKGWVKKHDLKILFVDYLQLLQGEDSKSNREQEVSKISRALKSIAAEFKIPVVALAQLSRETEKRGDKVPQLSDLRDSGALEQDASIVLMLYRPEYYDLREFVTKKRTYDTDGLLCIYTRKNREGSSEKCNVAKIKLATQEITDYDDYSEPAQTSPDPRRIFKKGRELNNYSEPKKDGITEADTDFVPF